MKKKIGYACLAMLIMVLIDGIIKPGYLIKSLIKILLFGLIPLAMNVLAGRKLRLKANGMIIGLAVIIYAVMTGGFFLTRNFIDYSNVVSSLSKDAHVTKDNYLFVFAYIAVFNSLLEEYFFRGFCFLGIKKENRLTAYLFSAIGFALYHTGMLSGWFHPAVYVLMITGLVGAGVLFDLVDEKNESIANSYLVHMSANLAINTVGIFLFAASA